MTDINNVTIIGRLTRDADLSHLPNGMPLCVIGIATNKSRKHNDEWIEEASFFDAKIWGKTGEAIAQYLIKGKQVAISGSLQQERWEKDGERKSRVVINCYSVQLLGSKEGGQKSDPAARRPGDVPGNRAGFDDDVPF